jgi:hypothetical protein
MKGEIFANKSSCSNCGNKPCNNTYSSSYLYVSVSVKGCVRGNGYVGQKERQSLQKPSHKEVWDE